jgi:hypothetical protein
MTIPSEEVLRAQNFIPRADFWFGRTVLQGTGVLPPTAQQVLKRSDVLSDWINQFDTDLLKPDSIVFCKFDYLQYLIQYLEFRNCKTPFILLTGQSDYPITDQAYDFVASKISVNWWGVNNECSRAGGVPLGIADDYCTLTMKSGFEQTTGNRLLYVNHRVDTFPTVRKSLYPMFADKPWATVRDSADKGQVGSYKTDLLDHKFILCPRGNGVDTHRMWEALYCGVIPVVQRSPVHAGIEGNLPVLFVDSYYEVTEELLNSTYQSYKTKTWNWNMLKVSWWMEEFRRVKNAN